MERRREDRTTTWLKTLPTVLLSIHSTTDHLRCVDEDVPQVHPKVALVCKCGDQHVLSIADTGNTGEAGQSGQRQPQQVWTLLQSLKNPSDPNESWEPLKAVVVGIM